MECWPIDREIRAARSRNGAPLSRRVPPRGISGALHGIALASRRDRPRDSGEIQTTSVSENPTEVAADRSGDGSLALADLDLGKQNGAGGPSGTCRTVTCYGPPGPRFPAYTEKLIGEAIDLQEGKRDGGNRQKC